MQPGVFGGSPHPSNPSTGSVNGGIARGGGGASIGARGLANAAVLVRTRLLANLPPEVRAALAFRYGLAGGSFGGSRSDITNNPNAPSMRSGYANINMLPGGGGDSIEGGSGGSSNSPPPPGGGGSGGGGTSDLPYFNLNRPGSTGSSSGSGGGSLGSSQGFGYGSAYFPDLPSPFFRKDPNRNLYDGLDAFNPQYVHGDSFNRRGITVPWSQLVDLNSRALQVMRTMAQPRSNTSRNVLYSPAEGMALSTPDAIRKMLLSRLVTG